MSSPSIRGLVVGAVLIGLVGPSLAGVVDRDFSTAVCATNLPVSMVVCPACDGDPFTAAQLCGTGLTTNATITVTLVDNAFLPVVGFPKEEIWLECSGLYCCPPHCIADYDTALGIEDTQLLVTLAGLVIGWSVLIMVYNLVVSARSGEVASTNPWQSRSPEWQITSPVPEMNYDRPPVVTGDPYDYSPAAGSYVNISPASPGD